MVTEEIQTPGLGADRLGPKEIAARIGRWPWTVHVYFVALAALFAPVLWDAAQAWMHDENQAHGVFIPPVILFLLWLRREEIAAARPRPTAWGLIPLALGLMLHLTVWLLRIQTQSFGIWAVTLALCGTVLILHGRDLWRVVWFPICFLLMAGGIPNKLIVPVSTGLQRMSSTFGAGIMQFLGFPIIQEGNLIQVPGVRLEVADVCSGIKKLVALFAFSLVYAYLFRTTPLKRAILIAATVPIAIFANVARVAGLIAVTHWGGRPALDFAHNWAEIVVLVLSFLMFVGLGKALGCKDLRFSL